VPDILICKRGDIAEGDTRLIKVGAVEIGVIFHNGQYYAYQNLCPHQGGPACEGLKLPQVVENIGEQGVHLGMTFDENDMHIVCPWHGWEFDPQDGLCLDDPAMRVATYPVRVSHGRVEVEA